MDSEGAISITPDGRYVVEHVTTESHSTATQPLTRSRRKKNEPASAATILHSRWRIDRRLADSGQSIAYVATDLATDKQDAAVVKIFKDTQEAHRIAREATLLASLKHPHILELLDSDIKDRKPWIVTPYCSGGNLADAHFNLSDDFGYVFSLFRQILMGVSYLHSQAPYVVHRDLKPENILLESPYGNVVVADFGICHLPGADRHTHTGEQVGPRKFMAPELEDGRLDVITPACDVYSLGKLLYWMCYGKDVFAREKHREPEWDLVKRFNDPRMEHLNRLFDRTIEFKPENRLKDASELTAQFSECTRLFTNGYNAVSTTISQRCTYCGTGIYKIFGAKSDFLPYFDTRQFDQRRQSLGESKLPEWKLMLCDQCGHVQLFRIEDAKHRGDWWNVK
jgi:serine/threonine protein kinase